MAGAIPEAALSEQLQEHLQGRRLHSAVFLTFRFEPGFFEQEVLPVLLDAAVSHAVPVKLVQLEDALRKVPGGIAVYFDANGLVSSDYGSARLDVKRIPVRLPHGIFHPKNAFLLVEDLEPGEDGRRARRLLVVTLSANLTRAGWWENVEVCHVEEIAEGERTLLGVQLRDFLRDLRRRASAAEHDAVDGILRFLRSTTARTHKSVDDTLLPHFFASGRESVPDFLDRVGGHRLRGTHLEILSPYFDDADDSRPLEELIARFRPKSVRVLLPSDRAGVTTVRASLYEAVKACANVEWGRLPDKLCRLGKADDAGYRFVHAKVYRFFTQRPKRELLFVGSVNLTTAAHHGGNLESGVLLDLVPETRPEFWLSPIERRPAQFQAASEDEGTARSGGSRLDVRFDWRTRRAEACWDAAQPSPELALTSRGQPLPSLPLLPPRTWTALPETFSAALAHLLPGSSFLEVLGDGDEPALLLVQEEGMSHRPSLLLQLSAADILRYWSLLTDDQRTAFLEAHAPESLMTAEGSELVARVRPLARTESFFDRFAGFFHAFGSLERQVREALLEENEKEATYRLFGRKYDSLGSLLDRVLGPSSEFDAVDRYVLALCAKQLLTELRRDHAALFAAHRADVKRLDVQLGDLGTIRRELEQATPDLAGFLDWFDGWFLRRARPVEASP